LLIISIVSGAVLLTISRSNTKQIQATTNVLAQTITLGQEHAMLLSSVLGLQINPDSFQLLSYQTKDNKSGNWVALDERAFEKQAIPNGVSVSVIMDNQNEENGESDESNQPRIIISTNGDFTPFTIYVGKSGETPRYLIRGESNGSLTVKAVGRQ
jgi:general secretion pathway protein H